MSRNYFGTLYKNVPEFEIYESFWWDDDYYDEWDYYLDSYYAGHSINSSIAYSYDKITGLVNWEEEYPKHIKRGRLIDNILCPIEKDNNLNTLSNFWPNKLKKR